MTPEDRQLIRAALDRRARQQRHARGCSECGCSYDDRTAGCATCTCRHKRRRWKRNAQVRALPPAQRKQAYAWHRQFDRELLRVLEQERAKRQRAAA